MTSKTINDFLRFLREKEQEYRMAYDEVHEKNYYQQDMLHDVEIKKLENVVVPDDEKVAFYDELGNMRLVRREANNTVIMLEPLHEWLQQPETQKWLAKLEQLLGKVRHAEGRVERLVYTPRIRRAE